MNRLVLSERLVCALTMSASCSFKDEVTGEAFIPSTWKKEVNYVDAGMQSSRLKTAEVEVQTTVSSMTAAKQLERGTETEQRQATQASMVGLQYVYNDTAYNEERLAAFLESNKEKMLSMLFRNFKSTVFDNYEPNWSKKNTELSAIYTFTSPHAIEGELHALDVSWNAGGSMIAVAYGRMDTSGWCYSNGYVCVWNLVRPDLDANNPHYTFETDTYATCVAFHPRKSHTLAVGTYSGEVIVFPNILESVPVEYSTSAATNSHREPISMLQWIENLQEPRETHKYFLCTAAQDGMCMYWTPTNKMAAPAAALSIHNKRQLTVGVEAMSCMRSGGGGKGASVPSVGSIIIIGLESGDLGRGRTPFLLGTETSNAATSLELDWLDGHEGPVQSVSTSPFFRHLLMTCSSDGSAHLYNDLERTPLLTLQPSAETKHFLYDAQFSPFRPSVVAMVSRSSFLHIFDLQHSQSKPLYSTEAGVDGAPVVTLSFNESSADWLATGDTRGYVRLWRLPTEVSQSTDRERAAVRMEQHAGKERNRTEKDPIHELLGFSL